MSLCVLQTRHSFLDSHVTLLTIVCATNEALSCKLQSPLCKFCSCVRRRHSLLFSALLRIRCRVLPWLALLRVCVRM